MAVRNPMFVEPGVGPGAALGWSLRSRVAREAIAELAPSVGFESFERFSAFVGSLATAERFFFSLAGADAFESGWVRVPFRAELDPAERDARVFDGVPVETLEWDALLERWEDATTAAPFADALERAWPGTDEFATDLGGVVTALAIFDGVGSAERFDGVWPELGR